VGTRGVWAALVCRVLYNVYLSAGCVNICIYGYADTGCVGRAAIVVVVAVCLTSVRLTGSGLLARTRVRLGVCGRCMHAWRRAAGMQADNRFVCCNFVQVHVCPCLRRSFYTRPSFGLAIYDKSATPDNKSRATETTYASAPSVPDQAGVQKNYSRSCAWGETDASCPTFFLTPGRMQVGNRTDTLTG
jgi:hypothetical protein